MYDRTQSDTYADFWTADYDPSLPTEQTVPNRDFFDQLVNTVNDDNPGLTEPIRVIPAGEVLFALDEKIRNNELPGVEAFFTRPEVAAYYANARDADGDGEVTDDFPFDGFDADRGVLNFYADGIHLNDQPHNAGDSGTIGAYVVALTWYATLTGESPVGLTAEPYELLDPRQDAELIRALQQTVWDVVTGDSDNPLVNAAIDQILNEYVLGGVDAGGEWDASLGGFGPKNMRLARETNLPLIGYEGNTSIYTEGRRWQMENAIEVQKEQKKDGRVVQEEVLDTSNKGKERIVDEPTDDSRQVYSVANYVGRFYPYDGYRPNDRFTNLMSAMQRHPRYAEVYQAHLDIAKDLGLYTQGAFVDIGRWHKHGQWGHKEYLGQPLEEATKWTALRDWVREHREIREKGVGTEPIGTAPKLPDGGVIATVFAGGSVSREFDLPAAGDGDTELRMEAGFLPAGVSFEQVDRDTFRVSGRVADDAEGGPLRFLVRALDEDKDPDWEVYTIRVVEPGATLPLARFDAAGSDDRAAKLTGRAEVPGLVDLVIAPGAGLNDNSIQG